MKTILNFKSTLMLFAASLIVGCSSFKGSANDTTGTNGATNGNGKIVKSGSVHNYNTK